MVNKHKFVLIVVLSGIILVSCGTAPNIGFIVKEATGTYSRSLSLEGDGSITDGGVLVFVQNFEGTSYVPVIMDEVTNKATFQTEEGERYMVTLLIYVGGQNVLDAYGNTIPEGVIAYSGLSITFTSSGSDTISFYLNSEGVGLFASGGNPDLEEGVAESNLYFKLPSEYGFFADSIDTPEDRAAKLNSDIILYNDYAVNDLGCDPANNYVADFRF